MGKHGGVSNQTGSQGETSDMVHRAYSTEKPGNEKDSDRIRAQLRVHLGRKEIF